MKFVLKELKRSICTNVFRLYDENGNSCGSCIYQRKRSFHICRVRLNHEKYEYIEKYGLSFSGNTVGSLIPKRGAGIFGLNEIKILKPQNYWFPSKYVIRGPSEPEVCFKVLISKTLLDIRSCDSKCINYITANDNRIGMFRILDTTMEINFKPDYRQEDNFFIVLASLIISFGIVRMVSIRSETT